jgi:hypothetical protein
MLQVERQRRRLQSNSFGDYACWQTSGSLLDQQAEDRQAVLVSKRTESGNCVGSLHGYARYYDIYRNVKRLDIGTR